MSFSIITYGFDPNGNHSLVTYGFSSAFDVNLLAPVIDIEVNSSINRSISFNSIMNQVINFNSTIIREITFRGDL